MSTPKISIIIPVYKVEKYLRRCLDSIVAQTFTDWECILIDDGSPDNSGKICDEYAEKDARFRVIHQENAGVSAARNAGLDVAKGEWIGFVDSDDWIETNMYEYLYNDALETKSDVVICGFVGQHKKRIQKMYGSEEAVKLLFDPNGVGGFSVLRLIASKKVNNIRFDTSMTYLEDMKFFYELFYNCDKVYWDNEPLYNYVQREDSVTHKYGLTDDVKKGLVFLDGLIDTEKNPNIKKNVINKKTEMCIYAFAMYVKNNDLQNESCLYLKKQIKKNITNILFTNQFALKIKCFAIAAINSYFAKLLTKYLN